MGEGVAGTLTGRRRPGLACLLACAVLLPGAGSAAAADYWVRVDTAQRLLEIRDGERVLQTMENISLGRNGVSRDKAIHDRTTPLGSYRVRRINEQSRFLIYFGFDYPNLDQAQRGFRSGRISYEQLKAIRRAHYLGQEPPANTPLGGMIGIHGLGAGDTGIHEDFDWTDGCIALTNEQALELARWVRLGTRVEVE